MGRLRGLLPDPADLVAMGRHPRADVVAGLTTGVVALPLALAFGVAAGMGASAGLTTAIVAGLLAAVFGGSRVQVSGPTGAMAVVLLPITAAYGPNGVLVAGVLAGVILLAAALLRVGRYIAFLPVPVVEGFTAGIAAVIALQQVPFALGVSDVGSGRTVVVAGRAVARFAAQPTAGAVLITAAVVIVMVAGGRIAHAFPSSLVAVAAATAAADLAGLHVQRIGSIPASLPWPALPQMHLHDVTALLPAALAIAALAGIESLLAATVADGLSDGPRHDPDRELVGQGVANLVAPLFGGMPATGAIARTAVSVRAGATSRLAAVVHSLSLVLVVLLAAPLVSRIPLAALAGVLLVTAARMADLRALTVLTRVSRSSALVLIGTLCATVLLDLIRAVEIGVAAAAVLALRQLALSARLDRLSPNDGTPGMSAHDLLDEHIVVFRIDGALFFASAHRLLSELLDVADVRVVILRLSRLVHLDATGAKLLAEAVAGLEARGVVVLLSGVLAEHQTMLERLGVLTALRHDRHMLPDIAAALAHAREHVGSLAAQV